MIKEAVIVSCFEWYEGRIEPIYSFLRERGYNITILTSDFDHKKKKLKEKRYEHCTYIHVPEYKKNISLKRIVSHLMFGKQVGQLINKIKPDLIYCQIPPNNVARECKRYKELNPKTKLVLDIIDLWPESMPIGRLKDTVLANIWKNWRDASVRVADHVFTECDLYQEKLKSILTESKTSTLYLYKEQTDEEKHLIRKIIGKKEADNVIRFAYLGSMNNIIDIEGICGVIKQFIENGMECELHAIGIGESQDKFKAAATKVGCKTFFYGKVFDEIEKIKILAPCDYAFNMMKGSIAVGLTIKSIDYLSYGLPLINNIKGDTWEMVEKHGIGINISENQSFVFDKEPDHIYICNYFDRIFNINAFICNLEYAFRRMEAY